MVLRRRPGPVALVQGGEAFALPELEVVGTDRGVTVGTRRGGLRVGLVEHLLAALGGLGVQAGVEVAVEGRELPLLDGTAAEWVRALGALGLARGPGRLRVAAPGELAIGASRYAFRPALHTALSVRVSYRGLPPQLASWDGTAARFATDIAAARTFGFVDEAAVLRERGLAAWVDPRVVLVLDEAGLALPPGRPMAEGELARHKLLDLIGDLYFHGGPPRGEIVAERPGHTATHQAVRTALDRGWLEVVPGA